MLIWQWVDTTLLVIWVSSIAYSLLIALEHYLKWNALSSTLGNMGMYFLIALSIARFGIFFRVAATWLGATYLILLMCRLAISYTPREEYMVAFQYTIMAYVFLVIPGVRLYRWLRHHYHAKDDKKKH